MEAAAQRQRSGSKRTANCVDDECPYCEQEPKRGCGTYCEGIQGPLESTTSTGSSSSGASTVSIGAATCASPTTGDLDVELQALLPFLSPSEAAAGAGVPMHICGDCSPVVEKRAETGANWDWLTQMQSSMPPTPSVQVQNGSDPNQQTGNPFANQQPMGNRPQFLPPRPASEPAPLPTLPQYGHSTSAHAFHAQQPVASPPQTYPPLQPYGGQHPNYGQQSSYHQMQYGQGQQQGFVPPSYGQQGGQQPPYGQQPPPYGQPSPGQAAGYGQPSPGQATGYGQPSPGQAAGYGQPSPGQAAGYGQQPGQYIGQDQYLSGALGGTQYGGAGGHGYQPPGYSSTQPQYASTQQYPPPQYGLPSPQYPTSSPGQYQVYPVPQQPPYVGQQQQQPYGGQAYGGGSLLGGGLPAGGLSGGALPGGSLPGGQPLYGGQMAVGGLQVH